MFKCIFAALLVTMVCWPAAAFAQQTITPERGSKDRTEILDALRKPVEKSLRQKIRFVVNDMNVSGAWAFVGGVPQSADGGRPDYSGTPYQEAIDEDVFDNNVFALFRKRAGKWQVVTYLIGCTDVCYAGWWKEYGAPKRIFPYTE